MAEFDAAMKSPRMGAVWSGSGQALPRRRPLARRARRLRPMVGPRSNFHCSCMDFNRSGLMLAKILLQARPNARKLSVVRLIASFHLSRDSFRSRFQRSE